MELPQCSSHSGGPLSLQRGCNLAISARNNTTLPGGKDDGKIERLEKQDANAL